jgi:hypothetical protein
MSEGDKEYLVVQSEPFLVYNDIEKRHKIMVTENMFVYEPGGQVLTNSFSQEIIVNDDPTDKDIFRLKLKGDTRSDHQTDPRDN